MDNLEKVSLLYMSISTIILNIIFLDIQQVYGGIKMKWQSIRILITLLVIGIISIGMQSCGSDEGSTNRTPTTDPSEPIVVATAEPIDFAAEKREINRVYSAFYSAFNRRKIAEIDTLWKEHPVHAQFGVAWVAASTVESLGPIEGLNQIKLTIESLWNGPGTSGQNWTGSTQFSQFWIRRKKSDPNTLEASARTAASYRNQQGAGVTYAYLVKPEHEKWQLQQIRSATQHAINLKRGDHEITKYFTDPEYKAP